MWRSSSIFASVFLVILYVKALEMSSSTVIVSRRSFGFCRKKSLHCSMS